MSTWADTAYLHAKRKVEQPEYQRQIKAGAGIILPRIKGVALDVGCGDGSISETIARNAPGMQLVAMDIGYRLTRQAKEGTDKSLTNLDYLVADASHLPFRDQAFDFVYALGTLHHVIELGKCVNDIARICKDEMVLVEPNKFSYQSLVLGKKAPLNFVWHGGMDEEERPLSPLFIKAILKKGRFKHVEIKARSTLPSTELLSKLFGISPKWLAPLDEKITKIINKTFFSYLCPNFILSAKAGSGRPT